jgi:hypothetical protein
MTKALWILCAMLAMFALGATDAHAQRRGGRERVCVAGAQAACACPGGVSGVQQCNPRGTGLLACECPTAATSEPAWTPPAPRRDGLTAQRSDGINAGSANGVTFARPESQRRWYGWQILITDVTGSLLSSTGGFVGSTGGSALAILGATVTFFGGPIVHWAHGHVGRGFASMFGLRLGLPLGGALLGFTFGCAASACQTTPTVLAASIGAGLGALTGIIVDIAVLAYDEPAPTWTRSARAPLQLSPWASIDPAHRTSLVGVRGVWF